MRSTDPCDAYLLLLLQVKGVVRAGVIYWIPDLFANNPKINVTIITAPTPTKYGRFGKYGVTVVGGKGLLISSPYETVHHSQSPSPPPNSTLRVGV